MEVDVLIIGAEGAGMGLFLKSVASRSGELAVNNETQRTLANKK